MSKINKIEKLSSLYDVYKTLLTDIQSKTFEYYYLQDQSLAEISEILNVSRASVSDTLKKTEDKLIKFEESLSLAKKTNQLLDLVDEIEDKDLQEKLKKII